MGNRKILSSEQETAIVQEYQAGFSQMDLAARYGVSQSVVSQITRKAKIIRRAKRTITSAPAPVTVSPEVLGWQAIAGDDTVDPDIRLAALVKLKAFERQQAPTQDDGEFFSAACDRCRQLGSKASWLCWGECPFEPKSKPTPAAPAPVVLDSETQELLDWFEQNLEVES
jgi:hypothetical protein